MKKYIETKYNYFKKEFEEIIDKNSPNQELKLLIYSIMIYENFSRPKVYRFFEDISPGTKTRGIMQVKSSKKITDVESLQKAIVEINRNYRMELLEYIADNGKSDSLPKYRFDSIVEKYNNDVDYVGEVMEIYSILEKLP